MPTTSRYYNDPQIGQAFSNLAGMFEPPSGADLSGYATAAAKKAEAARLAELFDYTKRPDFNREQFDRMGVVADLYDPSNSFYSVDQGNAVTMRGQDVTSRTNLQMNSADNARALKERELLDAVLRANNADDNTRALSQTGLEQDGALVRRNAQDAAMLKANDADNIVLRQNNVFDNARAIQTNQADNSRAITQSMLAPVQQGATRFVPKTLADFYGADEQQVGVINAAPGEVITTPDNRVIRGDPKPLTDSEWTAQQNERLRTTGLLSDQMIADIATGKNTPVTVMRPGADKPSLATPGEATRLGLDVFVNQGAQAKPTNYRTPDGKQGTARLNANGKYVDTQTDELLPDGSITFGTNVQGNATDTGISTPANQTEATRRQAEIKFGLSRIQDFKKLLAANPGVLGVPGALRGVAQDIGNAITEMQAAYGGEVPAFKSIDEMKAFTERVAQKSGYDPAIRQALALASELAYIDAKAADPSGEVNVKEWERKVDQYNGGLGGNAGALAAADMLEQSMNARLALQVEALRNPGADPAVAADPLEGQTATNPQTGAKIVRRNGKWEPAQ